VKLPRLRAPAENGTVLAEPPLADVGRLADSNQRTLSKSQVSLGGVPLAELRRQAIHEAIAAARDYLRWAGEPVPDLIADSLLIAGHQPELFHPGVWLKNFAANSLARRTGRASLNLVVNNDTAKATTVRLPTIGTPRDPTTVHLSTVPFDHFSGEVPYEERAVQDESVFADFPRLVGERAGNWGYTPILPEFWAEAERQRGRTRLLGERFAAARRTLERRWGCHNREVPTSRLCDTSAFARFAIGLFDRLPDFRAAYNDGAREYRRRHGIRSPNHPVPDLRRDGDWLEAPFWAWQTGQQHRARLFVRQVAGGWRLRAGADLWPDLPHDRPTERWCQLRTDGFRIRTRALTTTLFARLCLADLFIHGIGGGKYDELTDTIIERFFGIQPPAYLVLTGTLQLPLPPFDATAEDEQAARRIVRDIYWNPQRHLPPEVDDCSDIAIAKLALARSQTVDSTSTRFRELRRLTERLRPPVRNVYDAARQTAKDLSAQVKANEILRRRDYAFCLFPESSLRPFLTRFGSTEPEA
jgi:hypothetical protein